MHLYHFIRSGAPDEFKRIIWMAALSGGANAFLVSLINSAAGETDAGRPIGFRLVLLYVLAFSIYYLTNRHALMTANAAIERMLRELRLRILDRIRRAELLDVDKLGKGDLFTKLIQETNHLSQSFPVIVNTFGQFVLLFFCLLYIAYLSLPALLIVLGLSVAGVMSFLRVRRSLDVGLRQVSAGEAQLLDQLGHMVDGFKEVKVNRKKSDALYSSFTGVAKKLESDVVGIGGTWIFVMQFANIYLYLLLGIISFILPQYITGFSDNVYKITAASLFCIGPLASAVAMAPAFMKANLGLEQIFAMEAKLNSLDEDVTDTGLTRFGDFQKIEYRNMLFSYRDELDGPTFTSGPWDLELKRGEVVFLVGGNGSGKSTVLKLLTGLYPADSGTIKIDGLAVDGARVAELRELFSIIFADFHLFDRLYGLEHVEEERVRELIARMELSDKVTFEGGRFSTLNLSTGQRKRLALIAALLEDRPIYVFDEWAADQDLHFREIFYQQILSDLKARNKTVVAVTHDDRFWNRADRVVKMELGQMQQA